MTGCPNAREVCPCSFIGAQPAQVDLHAPQAQEPGAPAAKASFTMANSTNGIPFTIAWPTDVNGPVEIGSLTGGVPS